MSEIKVTPSEFGLIVNNLFGSVNPYDLASIVEAIIDRNTPLSSNDVELNNTVIGQLNRHLKKEGLVSPDFKVIRYEEPFLVLNISNDLGKQQDLFGKESILPILRNAGIR